MNSILLSLTLAASFFAFGQKSAPDGTEYVKLVSERTVFFTTIT